MSTITDFSALGLMVGRITEVADLEGARKPIYRLKVDLGEAGIRDIAAGLKDHYSPEQLLGTDVIVVTGLEPRNIAGFVSQGMLLAAEDETGVALLRPERTLKPGSPVR